MTDERHGELRLLVQADIDGELPARDAAIVAAHLADCAPCRALQRQLRELKQSLRAGIAREPAPDALRRKLVAMTAPAPAATRNFASPRLWGWTGGSFGLGALVAAALLLFVVVPRGGDVESAIVDGHVRALQPGHLLDVASSNQHTVKPWFDGRLDFAPPVKDLAAQGFPLAGGRLDYLGGRSVAALAYGRQKHIINLFIWPQAGIAGAGPDMLKGYNIVHWSAGGMNFWAVSDLERGELESFARDWQATP